MFTVHPLLHDERTGVGVGVALVQEQLVLLVQLGLRHELLIQTSPLLQSLLTVHVLLHPTVDVGVGVGVFVGVLVGVFVGVFVGVPVRTVVGVGVARTNESVQAGSAAFGVTCGTLGATGVVRVSCWLVMKVSAANPTVISEMTNTYQFFFIFFIVNATRYLFRTLQTQ